MLFGNLAKNSKENRPYLGAPEAEAEATEEEAAEASSEEEQV